MKDLRNRVHLIGNLGKDPEVINFKGNNKLAKFSVATSQSYTNSDGEWVKDTQWHSIVAWGKLAETTEKYLKKGMEVALEGKLVYRKYEDKEGITRYMTEIVLSEYIKISKKEASEVVAGEK
ncbi:MAG: single-stranded DNA-binding protein [Bacteroidales bacterium]|nr:single-stranded DNA-binding protein [Bacteroidales bacterium]